MDYQFLFNPFKTFRMNKPSEKIEDVQIEGGRMCQPYSQHANIKHFQPIVRSKTKGGSLAKSNNIRMIF
jgi:hypothetical protein